MRSYHRKPVFRFEALLKKENEPKHSAAIIISVRTVAHFIYAALFPPMLLRVNRLRKVSYFRKAFNTKGGKFCGKSGKYPRK